jgi:Tol biopolymer transport system component
VFEGFCEYNTQNWAPWSALIVRDAALNDRIPELVGSGHLYSRYPLPRPPDYDFGHALFDFIEYKYGKNGIRDFWHSMKNTPLIGNQNPIKRAFDQPVKEFNYEFKKYLRAIHKPFLTRENPEDYSIPLGPEFPMNPYYHAYSIALSPSGDIVAALLANYKDLDYDIILFSTKDGKMIKNITKGYTLKYEMLKFEVDPSMGKDLAWSADGDRIAFFGRAGAKHSLFIINPLTGKIVEDFKILQQDQPSSPSFFPNGQELLFTAFEDGIHDIFKINLSNGEILNLTANDLFEKAPTISHDGEFLAYTIRMDAYDKLFISPLNDLKKRTQLTFGEGNTITPTFSQDDNMIFFAGDKKEAHNIYSIDLKTAELKRYTDVRTGNFFPYPMPNETDKIVFSSFNKGAFQIFKSELEGQVEESVTFADMDYEEEFERFEPIVTIDIDEKKIKPYRGLNKLFLNNRPPIGAVISTDGSIYGGTALSFSDLLGDHNFNLLAYQVRSFRSYVFSYVNLKKRFQYMAEAFQYTIFYYSPYSYLNESYYQRLSYRDALATRTMMGARLTGFYPFNRYFRAQVGLSFLNYEEELFDPSLNQSRGQQNQLSNYFFNGNSLSASAALVGETTNFRYYGPYSGNTFMLSLSQTIPVTSNFIMNTTTQVDLRQYMPIGGDTLFAFRLNVMASMGKTPYIFYWGGNNQVRSSYYYNIIGNTGWYANLEFRIPLVNAASTLLGQIGPFRGVFFFDMTRAQLKGYPAKIYDTGYDEQGIPVLRVADAIGSYGFGFQFFFLGLPLHFEWAKRLEIENISSPFRIKSSGKFDLKFWIGFDF